MLADYHVHTHYSDDSLYPMEDVVRDAIALGLDEICFTDHVDYGIKRDPGDPRGILCRPGDVGEPEWMPAVNPDYPQYVRDIRTLQERYRDRIRLKLGLEFGVQAEYIPQYNSLFHRYDFDFILLSVHEIGDKELWNQRYQEGKTQQEIYDGYYNALLTLSRDFDHYCTLAHMDLVSRYDKKGGYPFEKVRPAVIQILKTLIEKGKGIEVNTSHIRYGLADMTPSRDILKLYRSLGGEILTIGSDSHKGTHLGAHILSTHRALRELGFSRFCTYDAMQPTFHPLEM